MRLDKYLSHAGVGTRKEVKQLIDVYKRQWLCLWFPIEDDFLQGSFDIFIPWFACIVRIPS